MDISNSTTQFVLTAIVLAIAWGAWSLRNESIGRYFRTDDGKGILKGIFIALAVAIGAVLLTGCSTGTWGNDAEVFAGLEYPKNKSPMCEPGTADHTTGNLGFRGNIYESDDGKYRANLKYTHHSCAFGSDSKSYDAIGGELTYRLWSKE